MDLESITLGDTLNFSTTVPDYEPGDGWVLKYRFVPRSVGSAISVSTTQDTEDPGSHRFQVAAADTAAWTAGAYSWFSYVENSGGERHSVGEGQVTFNPDPRTASTLDNRSSARVALDNVRAMLSGKASSGVLSYSIGGRTLQSYSIPDLLQLESKLVADVKREDQQDAIASGRPSQRRVFVRAARA